jgi:thiamine-monophosphate kinase
MGATEVVGLTVGLVAPATTRWRWVEAVYEGIQEALQVHGGVLLGGDCSGGSQRLLAVTAIGRLRSDAGAIRRSDGRPGDLLVSTGVHGLSRLGLALLRHEPIVMAAGQPIPSPGSALGQRAIQAHCRPVPRFDAVCELIATRPRDVPWRVGGCDSSDGLAAAVAAIARASGCQAILIRDALPLDPAMAGLAHAETWCLQGGEDFELVLALEPGWAETLLASLPGTQRIGTLVAGDPGGLGWADGAPWAPGEAGGGYSHFSADTGRRAG